MRVIAIDPGVTTGLVVAEIMVGRLQLKPTQEKLSPLQLYKFLSTHGDCLIICEDFEFRPKSPVGLVMTSAHLIGVIMLHSEETGCGLRMQNAAYAKAGHFKSIQAMKNAGVYVGGANYEHAMDAMRHFMQWFQYGPGYQFNKTPQVVLDI